MSELFSRLFSSTDFFFMLAEVVLSIGSNAEGYRIASSILSAVAEPNNWIQTYLNSMITATYELTFLLWMVVLFCYFFYEMLYMVFDITAEIRDVTFDAFRVGHRISMGMFWICLCLAAYGKLLDSLFLPLILLQFSAYYAKLHADDQIARMNAEYEAIVAHREEYDEQAEQQVEDDHQDEGDAGRNDDFVFLPIV